MLLYSQLAEYEPKPWLSRNALASVCFIKRQLNKPAKMLQLFFEPPRQSPVLSNTELGPTNGSDQVELHLENEA